MTSTPEDEAAWQAIVANYGAEPEFPPVLDEPEPVAAPEPDEGHFVPPAVPPAPRPVGLRGLAWVGVIGVPILTLLLAVLPWHAPGWLLVLLLAWFAGGFVYLVATMNGPSRDGWDDGAVV